MSKTKQPMDQATFIAKLQSMYEKNRDIAIELSSSRDERFLAAGVANSLVTVLDELQPDHGCLPLASQYRNIGDGTLEQTGWALSVPVPAEPEAIEPELPVVVDADPKVPPHDVYIGTRVEHGATGAQLVVTGITPEGTLLCEWPTPVGNETREVYPHEVNWVADPVEPGAEEEQPRTDTSGFSNV